jgi:cellulose synthase/poly-beta-1,6-N-acetylglucosamine synthase-like glycosyltransferase
LENRRELKENKGVRVEELAIFPISSALNKGRGLLNIILYGSIAGFLLTCAGYIRNKIVSRSLKKASNDGHRYRVAVVIAAKDEEAIIRNTIHRLLCDVSDDLSIFVVDDGSTDATLCILNELAEESSRLIVRSNEGPPGKPAALNTALKYVTEDIVLFLDADAYFDKYAIERYLRAFADPSIDAIFADFGPSNKRRTLAVMLHDLVASFEKAFLCSGLFTKPIFGNCGLFVRRSVLETVGAFDPGAIVEDYNLRLRMAEEGYKTRFILGPKCKIQYAFRMKDLFYQYARWYTGAIRELFGRFRQRRWSAVLVLAALGLLIFFPYWALLVGFTISVRFMLIALPLFFSAFYAAALSSYLFYEVKSWKETLFHLTLGLPVAILLFHIVMAVSFFRAFRRTQKWYKVVREKP